MAVYKLVAAYRSLIASDTSWYFGGFIDFLKPPTDDLPPPEPMELLLLGFWLLLTFDFRLLPEILLFCSVLKLMPSDIPILFESEPPSLASSKAGYYLVYIFIIYIIKLIIVF